MMEAALPLLVLLGAGGVPAPVIGPPAEKPAVPTHPTIGSAPSTPHPPPPPLDPGLRRTWLKGRLDELFSAPHLANAKISAIVTDSESGKALYARGEKSPLNAASNVKILTSAAALALLGPEYRWKTVVYGPAKDTGRWLEPGGELPGDLYLRGSGDPTLGTEDLASLASKLSSLGLKKVRGALVVDATFFEGGALAPAYEQKLESASFRAPSSAASLNGNAVAVTIMPGASPGAPARVVIDPPSPYFLVTGRVITASGGPSVPQIETTDGGKGTTRITVGGRIRLGSEPRTFYRRVIHPELFFGHTFRQILSKRGISVEKPLRLGTLPAPVGTSNAFRTLAAHDSPALAVIVHDLNKRSNNFAAEQVIRTLGAEVIGQPGNWDKGLDAVGRYLESVGVARGSYKMTNGAGLYDSNRFSAEQIAQVIRGAMRDFRIAGEFLASLSVAGADGTLAQRMGGTSAERYVRAKTGTLANVSCLSGIAGATGQRPLVFSILMNDVASPFEARGLQDRIAEILVSFLEPNRPLRTN